MVEEIDKSEEIGEGSSWGEQHGEETKWLDPETSLHLQHFWVRNSQTYSMISEISSFHIYGVFGPRMLAFGKWMTQVGILPDLGHWRALMA